MNDIEVEIQTKVEHIQPLLDFLKQNAEFKSEKHQIDEYFVPPHRDFLSIRPVKEWLRLRDSGGQFSLNYKNWHYDKGGQSQHYCDEFETEIKNPKAVRKIFTTLNFKPIVTVDKIRKIWVYKNYEIAIDSVNGAGDFVEVEYTGKEHPVDNKKIVEEMINFLKNLGCGKIMVNNNGYPFLLLFPNEAQFETR